MQHLDRLVEIVNTEIKTGLSSLRTSVNAIVRRVEKGTETLNYDINEKVISFDDANDVYLYHREIESLYTVIQGRGKKYLYSVSTKMELICYSKLRNAQDYLTDKLSNIKDLEITGSDNDSIKIFKEESGKEGFDLSHYVFKINYNLKYHSDNCTTCLIDC
jgi:hypothetical protein